MVKDGRCSGRLACRHFGLHRSTFAYKAKEPNAWLGKLRGAIRRCSREYPEMGYQKITRLLKKEGWEVGSRMVQKLRREMGLRVPQRKPKVPRRGRSTGLPTKADHRNHVWSYDFVHDRTMRGGALRMLNIIDEHTRESLCIHVDRRINAQKVKAVLAKTIAHYGQPEYIRSDNGPEFIAKKLQDWLAEEPKIKTLYIDPGSPWQNGYIESFNARLRDECLNREQLWTLTEARVVIEDWRWKYNNIRPHRSLGYITPIEFAYPEEEPASQYQDSSRPTASLRPAIDFLYDLRDIINPVRLTQPVAQFG
jgi:putative transposase